MANSEDPEEMLHSAAVCSGQSVRNHMVNTVLHLFVIIVPDKSLFFFQPKIVDIFLFAIVSTH